jgi:hypothetical protein
MDHAGGVQTSVRELQLATKKPPRISFPMFSNRLGAGPVMPMSLAESGRDYKILYWPEHSTPFRQGCFIYHATELQRRSTVVRSLKNQRALKPMKTRGI